MEAFLTLAGQLFLIACIQSVLEVLVQERWQTLLSKVVAIACYAASLALVLRFMQTYLLDVLFQMTQRL